MSEDEPETYFTEGKAKLGPNGEIIPVHDLFEWARWIESSRDERRICRDQIGGFTISTVFLGLDHSYLDGPPLWFETMVFRDSASGNMRHDQEYAQERYTTIEQARVGHAEICEKVRTGEIGE